MRHRTTSRRPAADRRLAAAVVSLATRGKVTAESLEPRRLMAATVSGVIYEDADADGVRDASEGGVVMAEVFLDANLNGVRDTGEPTGNPAVDGGYTIFNVAAGTHTFRLNQARGGIGATRWQTAPLPAWEGITIMVADGDAATLPDIGLARSPAGSRLGGAAYDDWNRDGAVDEGDTPRGTGTTVYLDMNNNRSREFGEPSAGTRADGSFELSAAPGEYLLRVAEVDVGLLEPVTPGLADGVRVTIPADGTPGTAPPLLVLPNATGRVGGLLWDDNDRDRAIDPGETGLAGRTVWIDRNGDRALNPGERRVVTGPDGRYAFDRLDAGFYPVRQVVPGGWVATNELGSVRAGTLTANLGSTPVVRAPAEQAATEGAEASFDLGRVVPPSAPLGAGPLTVTVGWGDGTPDTTFQVAAAAVVPLGTRPHAYADDGTYAATITVANATGQVIGSTTFTAVVSNLPPIATAAGPAVVNERTPATVTFSATDPSPADTIGRWEVDWGDGSAVAVLPGDAASAEHAFAAGGTTYAVRVRAVDDDGGASEWATVSIRVRTPAEAVADVRSAVDVLAAAGRMGTGEQAVLTGTLDAARRQIDRGRDRVAALLLRVFVAEVDVLVRTGRLAAADGDPLAADTRAVIAIL